MMAYYVADVTAAWEQAKRGYIDEDRPEPFNDLPYANPDELQLTAPEKEHKYTIGHGYRVVPDRAVKKAFWHARQPGYAIPDFGSILGHFVVSDKFRQLVERFEPGIHQFIPVEIYDEPDGELIGTYYWFNVCNRIDSTHHAEMKRAGWFFNLDYAGGRGHWRFEGHEKPPTTFDKSRIGHSHLWVDPYLRPHINFYATDEFIEAAEAEGITGVIHAQFGEA